MLKSDKKNFVSELEKIFKSSMSVIVLHYHGITVSEITGFRRILNNYGASLKVTKNTLARIAASNVSLTESLEIFAGPTAIAYSEDPIAAAKGVMEFAKSNTHLRIIKGIVNGADFDADEVEHLATLPSLDVLRGKIIGVLQAPSSNLARVVSAPSSQLARVLQSYADKK